MEVKIATYINLDRRPNKLDLMEGQLGVQNIPYFRTPGVVCGDFLSFPVEEEIGHGTDRHMGTVGCFLAHKNALISLGERDLKDEDLVMVFEDDVIIQEGFWGDLDRMKFPMGADIVFLNATLQHKQKPRPDDEYLVSEDEVGKTYRIYCGYPQFLGAFCYVLKFGNISRIVSAMESVKSYGDVDCRFYYPNFNCFTIVNKNIKVGNFSSDRFPSAHFNKNKIK